MIEFLKRYNYLLITIIIFGYYLSSLCIFLGFQALTTRLFIPVILLISLLFVLRINYFKSNIVKKTIFSLLFLGSIVNVFIMKTVLNEGLSPTRPYFEASRYLNQTYSKYDKVFSKHATPAPYITPACSIKCNIKPWNGKLEKNELLVSSSKVKGLKLIKSFESKNRYFKISFAEKDFYFYTKLDKE